MVSSMTLPSDFRIQRSNGSSNPRFGRSNSCGSSRSSPTRRSSCLRPSGSNRAASGTRATASSDGAVDQRQTRLERHRHARRVGVAQQPLPEEQPLLEHGDGGHGRPRRRSPTADVPTAPASGRRTDRRCVCASEQQALLKVRQEQRVGQLVQRSEVLARANHLRELGPARLRGGGLTGAGDHPAHEPRRPASVARKESAACGGSRSAASVRRGRWGSRRTARRRRCRPAPP